MKRVAKAKNRVRDETYAAKAPPVGGAFSPAAECLGHWPPKNENLG
jgi:hypothetical protein